MVALHLSVLLHITIVALSLELVGVEWPVAGLAKSDCISLAVLVFVLLVEVVRGAPWIEALFVVGHVNSVLVTLHALVVFAFSLELFFVLLLILHMLISVLGLGILCS